MALLLTDSTHAFVDVVSICIPWDTRIGLAVGKMRVVGDREEILQAPSDPIEHWVRRRAFERQAVVSFTHDDLG
ncbi:hypothetical protein [Methylobacterium sp. Leaf89]|uniref:hypothetical protein n=1 Tax=Methylobacterium sp. Leaf89 TaxID=1736245 RepID=UPI0006F4E7C0|nr:hypothetical protein [Methylobacterium sp. Leaf89]KQO66688.1 hypothetical protein ASF18_08005 [Methylobacterium sp. Leaf89]